MTVSIKVEERGKNTPAYNINADLKGEQTLGELLEFTKDLLISTAQTVLKEEQAQGFDDDPRVKVDNRFNKPVEAVKPLGRIQYFAKVDVTEALLGMYAIIEKNSPVDTGTYKRHNIVYVNGLEVARSMTTLQAYLGFKAREGFNSGDEIRFINVTPYARKLETFGVRRETRGKNKGTNTPRDRKSRESKRRPGKFITRPSGAYAFSFRAIKRKFSAVGEFLKFVYMVKGTRGITILGPDGEPAKFAGKNGRPYLYPSIVLRLSGEGILRREQDLE